MCGIIGFVDNASTRKDLKTFYGLLKHRGTDSYGVIVEKGNDTTTLKTLQLDQLLSSLKKVQSSDFVLCHNRKTSIGATTLALAHPITSTNQLVNVIHNGTKKALFNTWTDADSDTVAISEITSYHFKATKLMTELLKGSGVVFSKHATTGKVLFHSDEERPLFVHENRKIFASEPITSGTWYLVKEHTKVYNSLTHFIETVPVYQKSVTIEKATPVIAQLCKACNKTHLVGKTRCFVCEVKDTPVKVYSYPQYNTTNYYNNSYYKNTEHTNITPIKGKEYEFSEGNNVWVKDIFVKTIGFSYNQRFMTKNSTYKYVRNIKENIVPIVGKSYKFKSSNGLTLHGVLQEKIGNKYSFETVKNVILPSTTIIEEIEDHTPLVPGQTYLFWDKTTTEPKQGVFLNISDSKYYPYKVQTNNNLVTVFSEVAPIKEKQHLLMGNIGEETITVYKVDDFYVDAHNGERVYPFFVMERPEISKNSLIEVSEDNMFWEYGIVQEHVAKGNQKSVLVKLPKTNLSSETIQSFTYYRKATQ